MARCWAERPSIAARRRAGSRARAVLLIALALGVTSAAPAWAANCAWLGGAGAWSTAADWSCNAVPGQNDTASIAPAGSTVTLTTTQNVGALSLSQGNALTLTSAYLFQYGDATINGTITVANASRLSIAVPNLVYSGAGSIVLDNSANYAQIYGANSIVTFAAGFTARGRGEIGLNGTYIVNNGLISADAGAGTSLNVDPLGGNGGVASGGAGPAGTASLYNTGVMQATNGATLNLLGGLYQNSAAGIIQAINAGTVALGSDSRIVGGSLTSDANSVISGSGATQYLQGVTLTTGSRLNLTGDYVYVNAAGIVDNGVITIANASRLSNETAATTTYSGAGSILLDNSANYAQINGDGGQFVIGPSLTVHGAGQIGINNTIIVNNGLISADVAGGSLDVDPLGGNGGTGVAGSGVGADTISSLANNGTMQGDGATLSLEGGRYDNANGIIRAINGGVVALNADSRIIGGTLTSDATSVISASGTSQYLQGVTLSAGSRLNLTGDYVYVNTAGLVDNGTITIANASRLSSETNAVVTYSGAGTIVLDNTLNYAQITGVSGSQVIFGAGQTVRGRGQIGLNNTIIVNNGLISADVASGGLDIDPAGGNGGTGVAGSGLGADTISSLVNNATMQAKGATLSLEGGRYDNTNGIIQAINGGSIALNGDSRIIGGILSSDAASVIAASGTSQYLQGVTLATGSRLNMTGDYVYVNTAGLVDNGTITIANASRLSSETAAPVTYSGTGTIVLDNSVNYAQITGVSGGVVTFGQNVTVRGSGQIGLNNTVIVNNGLISADVATGALDIDPAGGNGGTAAGAGVGADTISALANNAILQANGATLSLEGGRYDNTNGTIRAINGGAVDLNGDSRVIGGALSSDAASVISASGTSQYLQGVTLTAGSRLNMTGDYVYVNAAGLVDDGTITIANASRLSSETAAPVTYSGSGTIVLDNSVNYAQIDASNGPITFASGLTVRGAGQIGLNNSLIVNNALISADAGAGTSIAIDPAGGNGGLGGAGVGTGGNAGLFNAATMQASNQSTLTLGGGLYENGAAGVIQAITGGTVALGGDSRIVNGSLASDATSVIAATGTTQYLQGVTLTAGSRLNLSGDYVNVNTGLVDNGVITIANASRLTNETTAAVTYSGSGAILLDNSVNYAQIEGAGGQVTFGPNLTVHGQGQIGLNNSIIVNNGLIAADVAGASIDIDATGGNAGLAGAGVGTGNNAALLNAGTLQAANGGTLSFEGGLYENAAAGAMKAMTGSTIVFNGDASLANLQGGGVLSGGSYSSITTGAASILDLRSNAANAIAAIGTNGAGAIDTIVTLSGANSVIEVTPFAGGAPNTIDSTLASIGKTGELQLLDGRSLALANAFVNAGTILIDASTLSAPSFVNSGTLSGDGTIGVAIQNTGAVTAANGVLNVLSINGSGTVTTQANGTLSLGGASSFGAFVNNGQLALNGNSVTIATDYQNANFGSGNSFNAHANVTGAGSILAASATLNVAGLNLSGSTLNVGNVRVGTSSSASLTLANNGLQTVLRGAVQNINAPGVTIVNPDFTLAPLGGTATATINYSGATSGSLAGQSLKIVSNFDNVAAQTISVVSNVYATAIANLSSGTINFGTVRQNSANVLGSLSVTNGASGALTDSLSTTIGATPADISVLAAPGALAAGASGVASFRLNTASAGAVTGSTALGFVSSDSQLAPLALASQSVTFTGVVTQLASAQLIKAGGAGTLGGGGSAYTVNLGAVSANSGLVTANLGVLNAIANTAYSEALGGSFAGGSPGAYTFSGASFSNLAGGASTSGDILTFNTAGLTSGTYTDTITLDTFSHYAGLADATLTPISVAFSANVIGAGPPGCTSNVVGSHVFALAGDVCTAAAAPYQAPLSVALQLPTAFTGFGFYADNGGVIDAPGATTITTTGATSSHGAWSDGAGATINFSGPLTITTSGASSFGLYASNGGAITASASATIATTGAGAFGVYASGAGSSITTSGAVISTAADATPGAQADNGGALSLSGGSISTSGSDSHALFVTGAGASARLSGAVALNTSGDGGEGVFASTGGVIDATSASLTIATRGTNSLLGGFSAFGVNADGAGARVDLGAATITTAGAGAIGLYASDVSATGAGGAITVAGNLSVTTLGQFAYGAFAESAGSSIALNGASAFSVGSGSYALYASGGGTITAGALTIAQSAGGAGGGVEANPGSTIVLNGPTTISLSGPSAQTSSSAGLFAAGGTINAGALSVTTSGAYEDAVVARGGSIALAGPTIVTLNGANDVGLYAATGGAITAGGTTTINASGAGDVGVQVSGGSAAVSGALKIAATDPTAIGVRLTGASAAFSATGGGSVQTAGVALKFDSGTNLNPSYGASLTDVTVANASGDLILVDPSTTTINLSGSSLNAGAGNLLDVVGGSASTLNASASTLTGAIATDAASTSSLNLSNGSLWTVTGSSTLTNLVNNASAIVVAPGGGFKTLTTTNYSGAGGATLTLNASLAAAASDQLVISGGAATGSTQLKVVNSGGGALTTGAGVTLVKTINGGTTSPNAFALAGPLVAGGYQYLLFRSSAAPGDQNYYLRSQPASTSADIAASLTGLAQTRQSAVITNRILGSILLGANEQVNCSNCASGFAAVGSLDVGAHGRWSLSDRLTILAGVAVDQFRENGAVVDASPTIAASLRYDFVDWGKTRPFLEAGGAVSPYQETHYTRSYANGGATSSGVGSSIERGASAFARIGGVSRITPVDEIAAYADVSRNWDQSGGYSELSGAANPFVATIGKGVDSVDIFKFGAQYTHLVARNIEVNVNGGFAHSFSSAVGVGANVDGFGAIAGGAPKPISWFEYGGRVGYRASDKMTVDAFLIGTIGPQPAGHTIHGGLGLRFAF